MYKELVISIIIIISIFALDYITQKYTDFAINEAISLAKKEKDEILDAQTSEVDLSAMLGMF